MLRAIWTALTDGWPDAVGSCLPDWTPERVRQVELASEHYLHGTVTAPRVKPLVRDQAAIDERETRLLEMAQAEFQARRRVR